MRGDGAILAVSFPQFFGHPLERHIAPRHAFLVASGRPSGGEGLCTLRLLDSTFYFVTRFGCGVLPPIMCVQQGFGCCVHALLVQTVCL